MMNPEDSPRYIPARSTISRIGRTGPEELEALIGFHEQMSGMFLSEGWRSLQSMLTDRQAELLGRLKHGSLAEVETNRGALSIVEWLLGLEAESTQLAAQAQETLYELRGELD